MTLRTLNYGNYATFLIMGNAGFCPSTVFLIVQACDASGSFESESSTYSKLRRPLLQIEVLPNPKCEILKSGTDGGVLLAATCGS